MDNTQQNMSIMDEFLALVQMIEKKLSFSSIFCKKMNKLTIIFKDTPLVFSPTKQIYCD